MVRPGVTVLLGGARSGKSALAVQIGIAWGGPVYVVATAEALDDDMADRIARHRDARPGWPVTEAPIEVAGSVAGAAPDALVIVDCLTLWVANLIGAGCDDTEILAAAGRLSDAAKRGAPTIIVTNEVGMGVHPETAIGRRFRDLLGMVNTDVVARSDHACLLIAGRAVLLQEPTEVLT